MPTWKVACGRLLRRKEHPHLLTFRSHQIPRFSFQIVKLRVVTVHTCQCCAVGTDSAECPDAHPGCRKALFCITAHRSGSSSFPELTIFLLVVFLVTFPHWAITANTFSAEGSSSMKNCSGMWLEPQTKNVGGFNMPHNISGFWNFDKKAQN